MSSCRRSNKFLAKRNGPVMIRGVKGDDEMVGVLLTAGKGVRMRPLTDRRAKGSLPLCNLPLFAHGLHILRGYGCRKVVMNLHSHPDSIISLLPDTRPEGLQVELSRESTLMGSAGGIKKMERHLSGGPFWILNGDTVLDLEFEAMLDRHRTSGALATLALAPQPEGSKYSPVEIDDDGFILRIAGKPEAGRRGRPHTFIGVQLAEPDLLGHIPPGIPVGITDEVYPRLIGAGAKLAGFVTRGFWLEMGNPAAYVRANLRFLDESRIFPRNRYLNPLPGLFTEGEMAMVGWEPQGPALLAKRVRIGPGVRLEGGVILGKGVVAGRGCRIRRTLLWEGSRIGEGAILEDCIVGGATIPAGATLVGKVALPGEGGETRILELASL